MITENDVRTGGENVGDESGSTSEDEEIDVVDNEGDLDEHRDSDGNNGDGGTVAVFNPEDTYDPTFELGMRFSNKHEFTFMSDKQKGLMQAFEEVFPGSDHRFCVRHLHNNFKQARFRGLAYKNALWKAAKACTVIEFKKAMQEMKGISQAAVDWFNDKPPTQWSRSHFSGLPVCDMLLNNEPTEDAAGNQHNRKVQVFTLKNHYGFLINLNLSKQQIKRKAETGPQEPGACSSDPTQGDIVSGSNANHGVENPTIQPPESGSNANHPTILPPVHEDIHEEDVFEDAVITQEWHDVTPKILFTDLGRQCTIN
ncbi:UNVERIFIED_CONTAM: hypothetical protein Sradi_2043800 [Sesamum radiatum]|uniref:MULE transposase domain-containing protein n=1 Tax=Sesamum radiatum TaxID=300843 RepID=A0AAW2TGV2_SESRA